MALDTRVALGAADYYKQVFVKSFQEAVPFYPLIANTVRSERESEPYAMLGSVPAMREWLGDRQLKQMRASDYRLANRKFETSMMIDKDKIADNVHGFYDIGLQQLGQEAAYHPDALLYELLGLGQTLTGWDGTTFFATNHQWGDSGAQSNNITSDVATPTAITAEEAKASYNQARTQIMGFKNDHGQLFQRNILAGQQDFMLLIPPQTEQDFKEALKTEIYGFTNGLGGNENVVLDRPRIMVSPMLTDPTVWYLFRTNMGMKPFVFQERQRLAVDTQYETNRFVKDIWFGVDTRYAMGFLAWWNAIKITLT
jgi:phage major head subunit gpT-like protein